MSNKVDQFGIRIPKNLWGRPIHQMSFKEAIGILSGSIDPLERLPVIEALFPDIVKAKSAPKPPPVENSRLNMLWREFHEDNNATFSLFGNDGLQIGRRYVDAVAAAKRRGEMVPNEVMSEVRKTEYFCKKTEELMAAQKREIAALLGDPDLNIESFDRNLPRIVSFLKLAQESVDETVSQEASEILNALMHRHAQKNKNDASSQGPKP